MSVTIHVSGPGIDRGVTLAEGAGELTIGRDTAADIHLPDPEKAISRKHLAIRLHQGLIEFRVVSSINGVSLSNMDVPPGATGVLPPGELLTLGSYTLVIGAAPPVAATLPAAQADAVDPWAALESEFGVMSAAATVPVAAPVAAPAPAYSPPQPVVAPAAPAPVPLAAAPIPAHPLPPSDADDPFASFDQGFGDDPFSEWASSFNGSAIPSEAARAAASAPPPAPQPAAVAPAAPVAAASAPAQSAGDASLVAALFGGLGLPVPKDFAAADAEHIGRMTRLIVEGFADLLSARAALKRELRAEDRTMLNARGNNPLKLGLTTDQLLAFLFASGSSGPAYMTPQQAMKETVTDLRAHEVATIAASRAAVQGALQEFEPVKLKTRLTKGKTKLPQFLDNARLWDMYQQHYTEQQQQMSDWLDKLFDRHFMPVYSKESERLRLALDAAESPEALPRPH